MAKLSARGRTELARLERSEPDSRHTLVAMSDLAILEKTDFNINDPARRFSSGWKFFCRLADRLDLVNWIDRRQRLGYRLVHRA